MLGVAGPPYVIESFRPQDVVSVLRLVRRSLGEEVPFNFLLQISALKPNYCKVARDLGTGDLLGLIVGTKESGHGGRVLLFAVDPEWQGRGVGRTLLRSLQQSMTLEDVRQVELEVRADNHRAIDFYQRHGFEVTGFQEGAYKDGADAYVMAKPLR